MRLLSRLAFIGFFVIACGLITAFVVVNNGPATIYLWPSDITLSAEIWVFILGAFAAGILFGGWLFVFTMVLLQRLKFWLTCVHVNLKRNIFSSECQKCYCAL